MIGATNRGYSLAHQKPSQELRPFMISGIDLFRVAGDRMRYLTERQAVIARNIANADTPDFKAQDLAPFNPVGALSASGGTSPLSLVQTNPAHMSVSAGTGSGQH